MDKYIDMHCHILPEVDDGAGSMEETIQMLQLAYEEGIRCIIATPHHHPRRGRECPQVLRRKLASVRREAGKIDDKFRVYMGMEVFFGEDIPKRLQQREIITMNNRNSILVEFSPMDSFGYMQRGMQQIQMAGYNVILAHAERYHCLVDNMEFVEHFWNMGIDIQVNAGSIVGESGIKIKKFVKQLMVQNWVFGVGTDAHGPDKRAPRMKHAAEYVKKKYGEEYMRRIFFGNAFTLLKKTKYE